jgi:N6-L-threonylcarbamoyladenine synthase/tRNA threonylcarbamoyladenosine biosynthesis protein TsaB
VKIFSIELSSSRGSIALLDGGKIVFEKSWVEDFKNRQQLFDALAASGLAWEEIELFAVGRGPGAFSGLRISFSVANALAAPGGKPLYALNSGAALAAQFNLPRLAVVGDARRKKVWVGIFSGTSLEKEFRLLDTDELADFIPPDALVVSPDYDRLKDLLQKFTLPENPETFFPTAGKLAEQVFTRLQEGLDSEPLEPLYMHPPVFVKPRFFDK